MTGVMVMGLEVLPNDETIPPTSHFPWARECDAN